jgi:hypothetical protein
VGAWSPSLDEDLDPAIGVEWVGLCLCLGTNEAYVFLGSQLGNIDL